MQKVGEASAGLVKVSHSSNGQDRGVDIKVGMGSAKENPINFMMGGDGSRKTSQHTSHKTIVNGKLQLK